jgi:uncharacterized membrane protein YkvA (DUF1232 family)
MAKVGVMGSLLGQLRLTVRLLRDPAVPLLVKAVPVAAAAYLMWPLDVLPDILPIVGQLDDIGIVTLALSVFFRLSPAGVTTFHRAAVDAGRPYSPVPVGDDFIDVEFKRH